MFDVGFLELAIILVLGLLVLGPERLPKVAKTVGYWIGKTRRYLDGMKSQVEAEFDTSEVKRLLHNQEVQIRELQNKITDSGDSINSEYHNQFDDIDIDDPGSSHEEAANAAGPQYDIIEEDDKARESEEKIESSALETDKSIPAKQPLDKAQ